MFCFILGNAQNDTGPTLPNLKNDNLTINDTLKNDSSTVKKVSVDTLNSPDALEHPVKYLAKDSIRIDMKSKKVYLFGEAEVYYEDIELKAENIEIDMDSNIVSAKGKQDSTGKYYGEPVFTEKGSKVNSHEMKYNFNTKKGLIVDAVTHEGENYIHGEKIYKTPDDILYIKHGKYTTCNLRHPHYWFSANKLKIIPEDKIVTGPANLVIEGVPTPIGIPFGFFPNSTKQKSGIIIPTFGESGQYGFFLLGGGYYAAISDNLSTQITGDFYSKGSWAGNMLTNYKKRYKYSGALNTNFSVFKNGLKEYPSFSQTENFFIKWNHTQDPKAQPNSIFSANVNFGNSENYTNNFNSSGNQYLTTSFNSNVSYKKSWAGKPFSLTLNGYHSQNTQSKTVTVRLPEVAFNVARLYPFKRKTTIGKQKLYEKIGISYSMNAKNEVTATDSLFSSRNLNLLQDEFQHGMKHAVPLSTSFKVLKHFTINPALNFADIWYLQSVRKEFNTNDSTVNTTKVNGFERGHQLNFSANATTKLYGMYQFKGNFIKAFRHVMTPSVGFTYTPENNSGMTSYYDAVRDSNITYSIFEEGIYGTTNATEAGLINLSVLNNFEMKVRNRKDSLGKDSKIKLLEALRVSTNYNIMADSLNWSDIVINARTNIKKINLNGSANFDPYIIDTTASGNVVRLNTTEYARNGRIGRLTSAALATGFSFKSKKSTAKKESNYGTEQELEYIRANASEFVDFNVPWTLNVNYNIRYSKPAYEHTVIQTLNFSGDVSLTNKWKIGARSGWDFEQKDFSYTSVDIYRDLHCWEMTFNWIPFGPRQSYLFTIRVKSALLQDLKLTRRSIANV
ncbi:MAG: putative LPS assembly protein LptD, partial [Vicingaceae bacterium]